MPIMNDVEPYIGFNVPDEVEISNIMLFDTFDGVFEEPVWI